VLYQSLSHRFALRSDDPELARRSAEMIADFARPLANGATAVSYTVRRADGPGYTLYRDQEQVAASEDLEVLLGHLLWQITTDTVELADGYLLIHAGAVVTPGGDGLLILGESGSGKSTLVAALVQEGFGYLSDEAAAIELETGLVQPWPRPLGFWPQTRSLPRFAPLLPSADAGERHVSIERIRSGAIAGPCRVRYVIDHRFQAGTATRIEPLPRPVALLRMGSAAPRLRHEGDRGLQVLARVIGGAGAYSLVAGDLDEAVRTIGEL
jgi:hypothetical protein